MDARSGFAEIGSAARAEGLAPLGAFHPRPEDGAPASTGTLVLLGPDAGGFWQRFRAAPEFCDHAPDPLDRWSARVIGTLAADAGGVALFPFGGPPYLPFLAWARRSGSAWDSPVGLLVHATEGLFVSYRGALALPARLALPQTGPAPCTGCAAPCLTACPVGALDGTGYDVPACRGFLEAPAGADCMSRGCAVRRACPVGPGQDPAQSSFHMTAFRGRHSPCAG